MSDSSDSESVNFDIPYSSRPEWADVHPIFQDHETNEIVRIAYTDTFKEVFDYFRAILKSNEKSDRAFELTKDAALLNPANYTVWYFRRILIRELNKDLNKELEFISSVINSHPKNYQVWQHRRNIVELLKDPSNELEFTRRIIRKDSKNYHAWQYRQWVIKEFKLWKDELNYVEELINEDVRNNSAWNQRYFYLKNNTDLKSSTSLKVLEIEIEYCLKKIDICIDNESAWNYLRAMINILVESKEDTLVSKVLDFCDKKYTSNTEDDRSPFLLSFIVDMNLSKVNRLVIANEAASKEEIRKIVKSSVEILELLGSKFDIIRVNYWNYQVSQWKSKFSEYI